MAVENGTHGERVKARILALGLDLLRSGQPVSARRIGGMMTPPVTHSAVLYHMGNSEGLRNAVAQEAVRTGCGTSIARLIVEKHAVVADMSATDRAHWLAKAAS